MQPTQKQQFDTALAGLTPQEQVAYTAKNPNAGQTFSPTGESRAINSAALAPTQPLVLPPTNIGGDAASALIGATDSTLQSGTDKLLADRQAQQATAEQKSATSYENTFMEALGVVGSRGTVEDQLNVSGLSTLANESFTALQASKRAQQKEIEEITRRTGGTTEGANQAIQAANRRYASEQADLAIAYDVANRNYTAAQATADRKIQLALEPLQLKLQFQKDVLDRNRERLDKTELTQLEQLIKKNEREVIKEEERVKRLEDTKIELLTTLSEQGASSSAIAKMQKAKTPEEAIIAASPFLRKTVEQPNGTVIEVGNKKILINPKTGKVIADFSEFQGDVGTQSAFQSERGERIKTSVDELMSRVGAQTVGFASLASFLPGSLPRNFRADLDTLKANIAFSELQAMREASKTGGALGQVAVQELKLLEATLGGLDQGQSPANFRKNLQKVKDSLDRWYDAAGTSDSGSQNDDEAELLRLGYTPQQIEQIKNAK